jgi:hypothetical protein
MGREEEQTDLIEMGLSVYRQTVEDHSTSSVTIKTNASPKYRFEKEPLFLRGQPRDQAGGSTCLNHRLRLNFEVQIWRIRPPLSQR